MLIYSLVECNGKQCFCLEAIPMEWKWVLLSIELRSQFIVAWKTFLIKKTPHLALDPSGKDFSILVGVVDVVRGAIPLQSSYIYNVDWLTLTWSDAPFHFKNKIYTYITEAEDPFKSISVCWKSIHTTHIYLYLYVENLFTQHTSIYLYLVGVGWRHSHYNKTIYISLGRRSPSNLFTAQVARAGRRYYFPGRWDEKDDV